MHFGIFPLLPFIFLFEKEQRKTGWLWCTELWGNCWKKERGRCTFSVSMPARTSLSTFSLFSFATFLPSVCQRERPWRHHPDRTIYLLNWNWWGRQPRNLDFVWETRGKRCPARGRGRPLKAWPNVHICVSSASLTRSGFLLFLIPARWTRTMQRSYFFPTADAMFTAGGRVTSLGVWGKPEYSLICVPFSSPLAISASSHPAVRTPVDGFSSHPRFSSVNTTFAKTTANERAFLVNSRRFLPETTLSPLAFNVVHLSPKLAFVDVRVLSMLRFAPVFPAGYSISMSSFWTLSLFFSFYSYLFDTMEKRPLMATALLFESVYYWTKILSSPPHAEKPLRS